MPYYLYKMSPPETHNLAKKLILVEQFDDFKTAKNTAKQLRMESQSTEFIFKVIFADDRIQAEELLLEKRDKPVLMEYER